MTDPQIALMMLGLFIVFVFLGFPIAFTLMAMGIGFGYYAYFEERRMWREFNRLDEEVASTWDQWSTWIEGFFNNRIFDLFVNQTFTVMSNEVLTAVPLFLVHGLYRRTREYRGPAVFHAQRRGQEHARLDGCGGADHLCALCDRHRHRRRGCHADGSAGAARDAQGAL